MSTRPNVVGSEASEPTQRLYWLRATLDPDQELSDDEQKAALAHIEPEDVFSALVLSLIDCSGGQPGAPTSFLQTDPEDANTDEDRAAALKVALGKPEHSAMLKTHLCDGLMVAPADKLGDPDAYVRYRLNHSHSIPLMARALREQGGVWLELFARGAPLAYSREQVKAEVMAQIKGARVVSVRQPPGMKTAEGASMIELSGFKPKYMVVLEHTEGLSRAFPPVINLPGGFPAVYRVDPGAFPHLCAKCHRSKTGGCICKAARDQVARRGFGGARAAARRAARTAP